MSATVTATPWLRPGKSHVSPWNFLPELEAQRDFPPGRKVLVTDGTIRAFMGSEPGALVRVDDMVGIARTLDEMGVVQIRLPGGSELAVEVAKAIARSGVKVARCGAIGIDTARLTQAIDENLRSDVQEVELEYGPLPPKQGFDYTEAAFSAAERVAEAVVRAGFRFGFGFNIDPEARLDYMLEFYRRMRKYDPIMFRIYDPFTCVGPEAMGWLVRKIRADQGPGCPPLVLHTHNAWGFGAFINIAAVQAGLAGVDIAANCLGNKAGHTDFAGTVMGLECLYGVDTGIKTELLSQLAYQVEKAMGTPLHPNTPFVGRHVFIGEKKILAVRALLDQAGEELDITPYSSHMVGLTKRVVWGSHVTTELVRTKLRLMRIEATDDLVTAIQSAIQQRVAEITTYPVWIEDPEAEEIIRAMAGRRAQPIAKRG
jgi:2-isopropylmalate synthase